MMTMTMMTVRAAFHASLGIPKQNTHTYSLTHFLNEIIFTRFVSIYQIGEYRSSNCIHISQVTNNYNVTVFTEALIGCELS